MIDRGPILTRPFWVVSDTHFHHKRIIELAGRPENHDELMLKNWIDTVGPRDRVLHLGDLAFGKGDEFSDLAEKLPGHKYIIRGNHDKRRRKWYRRHGFTVLDGFNSEFTDQEGNEWNIRFSHYPQPKLVRQPRTLSVHGHTHENVAKDKRLINVCVEQTDYKPVWIVDVLNERINQLERKAVSVA